MIKNATLCAIAAISVGFSASAAFAAEGPPPSNYTFNFTGKCSDCTGYSNATLTVQNYVPGQALTDANLVTFTYSSSITSFTDNREADINGQFPATDHLSGSILQAAGYYNITVEQDVGGEVQSNYFNSDTSGDWTVSNNPTGASDGTLSEDTPLDYGTNGLWNSNASTISSAPEPGAWALMMLGVGFIGWALGYRKRVLFDHRAKLALIP